MAQIKRFSLGVQALMVLASVSEQTTSANIAQKIGGEPTQIRKILSQLAEASIVEVKQGRSGGYELARAPEDITLAEIFNAVHEEEGQWSQLPDTAMYELSGTKVQDTFRQIMTDINKQIHFVLGSYTLQHLLK